MTEYERKREEIAERIYELHWRDGSTWTFEQAKQQRFMKTEVRRSYEEAGQILSLDGIEIRAENQDLNESSHFIWPQTTQSKEEMRRYQTGEIDKEEHERQRRQIIDEELAIYYKAQQDMLKPDSEGNHWVKCLSIKKSITCPICKGIGGIPLVGKNVNLNPCPHCDGKGFVKVIPKGR